MKISEYTLVHLSKVICGDTGILPYLSGPSLVHLFNRYGFNEVYGAGFPSRSKFVEDRLRTLNGGNKLKLLLEELVDARRFTDIKYNLSDAVENLNTFLAFDGFQLRQINNIYKVYHTSGTIVIPEKLPVISNDFITEQIAKCNEKILAEDFNGAITNARSLIEAIFIEIIEQKENIEIKNDGDIENLWKRVKKIMRLEIDKSTLPEFVVQILSGIDTSLKGLAGLSNNAGDRHANKFRTRKHHAKLAVNLSITISDFLLDSWEYQNEKASS